MMRLSKFSLVTFFFFFLVGVPVATGYPFWEGKEGLGSQIERSEAIVIGKQVNTDRGNRLSVVESIKSVQGDASIQPGELFEFPKSKQAGLETNAKTPHNFVVFAKLERGNYKIERVISDPQGKVAAYVREKLALNCDVMRSCVEFYVKHLESPVEGMANDAFNFFIAMPFEQLRKNIRLFPLKSLRRWVKNRKIPAHRRDFYCFLLGLRGQYQDRRLIAEVIDIFLLNKTLVQEPMAGCFLAYGFSGSSAALPMLMKALRYRSRETLHASNVLDAVAFIHRKDPQRSRNWLSPILRTTLRYRPALHEEAIRLATKWNEDSIAHQVVELFKKEETPAGVKEAILVYCQSITNEKCSEIVGREQKGADDEAFPD